MRASAARIMAEIRHENGLTVRDAWEVYRGFRDNISGKPSLAGLERNSRLVREIVDDVRRGFPEESYEDFVDYEDFYDWEVTAYYAE